MTWDVRSQLKLMGNAVGDQLPALRVLTQVQGICIFVFAPILFPPRTNMYRNEGAVLPD